jgi:hypothetical protein
MCGGQVFLWIFIAQFCSAGLNQCGAKKSPPEDPPASYAASGFAPYPFGLRSLSYCSAQRGHRHGTRSRSRQYCIVSNLLLSLLHLLLTFLKHSCLFPSLLPSGTRPLGHSETARSFVCGAPIHRQSPGLELGKRSAREQARSEEGYPRTPHRRSNSFVASLSFHFCYTCILPSMIRAVALSMDCALFRVGAGRRSDASDVPPPCLRVHASTAISPRLRYTLRCISGASHPIMIRVVGRDVATRSVISPWARALRFFLNCTVLLHACVCCLRIYRLDFQRS